MPCQVEDAFGQPRFVELQVARISAEREQVANRDKKKRPKPGIFPFRVQGTSVAFFCLFKIAQQRPLSVCCTRYIFFWGFGFSVLHQLSNPPISREDVVPNAPAVGLESFTCLD